ncbi:MAG: hypothetical protein ACYCYF_02795 [Anaerolineae bacterium]
MKLNVWMAAKAVVCVLFGLWFLLLPQSGLDMFGITAGLGGVYMTRFFGQSLVLLALLLWLCRNSTEPATQLGFRVGMFIGDLIGVVVALIGVLSGLMNGLGWSIVVVYLVFALGFGYLLLSRSPEPGA